MAERDRVLSVLRECRDPLPWPSFDASQAQLCRFTGGTTNSVWKASPPGSGSNDGQNSVVVRLFGDNTSAIIDRDLEAHMMELLGPLDLSPRIIYRNHSSSVTTFMPGRTLTFGEVTEYSGLIAREMARWHSVPIIPSSDEPQEACIWRKLAEWLSVSVDAGRQLNANLAQLVDEVQIEAQALKELLRDGSDRDGNERLCLCHNDCQPLNIVVDPSGQRVRFIDLEYAGLNPPLYDVANFMCENCGLDFDWSRFPSESRRREFIRNYLAESNNSTEPTEQELSQADHRVLEFCLAPNLLWGVWAIFHTLKGKTKPTEDGFCYPHYAAKRLGAYQQLKSSLGLSFGTQQPLSLHLLSTL